MESEVSACLTDPDHSLMMLNKYKYVKAGAYPWGEREVDRPPGTQKREERKKEVKEEEKEREEKGEEKENGKNISIKALFASFV